MTNREFFTAVIENAITDEVIAHAKASVAKLDASNEKKRNSLSKTQEANVEIMAKLAEMLTNEAKPAIWFGEQLGLSTSKVASLMGKLVAEGVADKVEIKVNKRKTGGYKRAVATE